MQKKEESDRRRSGETVRKDEEKETVRGTQEGEDEERGRYITE